MDLVYVNKKNGATVKHEKLLDFKNNKRDIVVEFGGLNYRAEEESEIITKRYRIEEIPLNKDFDIFFKDDLTSGDYYRLISIIRQSYLCDSFTEEVLKKLEKRALEIDRYGMVKING